MPQGRANSKGRLVYLLRAVSPLHHFVSVRRVIVIALAAAAAAAAATAPPF